MINKAEQDLMEIMQIDAEHRSVDFTLLVISTLLKDLNKDLPNDDFNAAAKEIEGEIKEMRFSREEKSYMNRYSYE